MDNKYNTATLPNGLRIIHRNSSSPVVYCGYRINAGTRNESEAEMGMAHFCEHASFKGTSKRSALSILNCLESWRRHQRIHQQGGNGLSCCHPKGACSKGGKAVNRHGV